MQTVRLEYVSKLNFPQLDAFMTSVTHIYILDSMLNVLYILRGEGGGRTATNVVRTCSPTPLFVLSVVQRQ